MGIDHSQSKNDVASVESEAAQYLLAGTLILPILSDSESNLRTLCSFGCAIWIAKFPYVFCIPLNPFLFFIADITAFFAV